MMESILWSACISATTGHPVDPPTFTDRQEFTMVWQLVSAPPFLLGYLRFPSISSGSILYFPVKRKGKKR